MKDPASKAEGGGPAGDRSRRADVTLLFHCGAQFLGPARNGASAKILRQRLRREGEQTTAIGKQQAWPECRLRFVKRHAVTQRFRIADQEIAA